MGAPLEIDDGELPLEEDEAVPEVDVELAPLPSASRLPVTESPHAAMAPPTTTAKRNDLTGSIA